MNISPSFAVEAFASLALAILVGCGPKDGVREFNEGLAAYERRDLSRAAAAFEKSLMFNAANVTARVKLAQVYLDQGVLDKAGNVLAEAEQTAGGDADVKLLAAQLAWHAKDYEKALRLFREIANDTTLDPTIRAQGLNGAGVVETAQGEHDRARLDFLRAIRLDRRQAAARYHLALLYRDAYGYNEAALEQFNVYVRLDDMASPRVQKTQKTVIRDLQEAITQTAASRPGVSKRNSQLASAAISEAESALKRGRPDVALKKYQEALAADALSYPAALGLAKTTQKTAATKEGMEKAFAHYKRACTLRFGAVSTYLAAGDLALRIGHYAESAAIYSRALAANPNSLEAIDGLIRALRKAGGDAAKKVKAYQLYRDEIAQVKVLPKKK